MPLMPADAGRTFLAPEISAPLSRRGNSIETGRHRQAFNISKLVQGSIGVDAVNADGA
jgi:hypothetical protein